MSSKNMSDTSLLAMSSKKRAMTGTFGAKHKLLTPCATRTIIFQRENLNFLIVFYHSVYLVFSKRLSFPLPICLPCIICGKRM